MCGGGGGGDSPLAQQSANQEAIRQNNIKEGMRQIETMFNGGNQGTGQLAAGTKYAPGMQLYDKAGNPLAMQDARTYRMLHPDTAINNGAGTHTGGGDYTGGDYTDPSNPYAVSPPNVAPMDAWDFRPRATGVAQDPTFMDKNIDDQTMQQQLDALIQGGAFGGVAHTKGYDDGFYDKAYQAQLDYSLPQVDQQFQKAQRDLTYALARQGLNASSQGTQLQTDLQGQRDLAIQGEQDKARNVRNQQVQSVESERDNLTKLLQSTGDVASTMNAAAARKNVLDSAPALQEVTPLFQNATGTLADMIVNPALRAAGQTSVSKGYGSTAKGSGKVVT